MARRMTALALTAAMAASLSVPAFAGTYYLGNDTGDITITKTDKGTYVKRGSDTGEGVLDNGEIVINGGTGTDYAGDQTGKASDNAVGNEAGTDELDKAVTLETDEISAPVVVDEDNEGDDLTYTDPTPVVTWPDEAADPETGAESTTDEEAAEEETDAVTKPAGETEDGETPESLVVTLEAPAPVSASKSEDDNKDDAVTYESNSFTQTVANSVTTAVKNIIRIINNVAGSNLNVTLDNVNIGVNQDGKAAVSVSGAGDTTIELDGNNVLTSGGYSAGLEHNTSDASGAKNGKLTIQDTDKNGSLSAKGGRYGAGIGGGNKKDGQVTITGGTIIAESGYYIAANGGIFFGGGAGIGGGYGGAGDVDITGGDISATGYMYGAGIGGGCSGDGNVTISGGTINKAASISDEGEPGGAGIGGGYCANADVKITGNAVVSNATGWGGGAGIGSGIWSDIAKVEISGNAKIENAQGGDCGAGIGGGYGALGDVSIEGNTTVNATGGAGAAGIGGGADAENDSKGNGNKVTIRGNDSGTPTVTATGGKANADEGVPAGGAGIGSGSASDSNGNSIAQADADIAIEGKVDITAAAGDDNAAIGANGVEQEFAGLADGSSIKRKDADGTDITLPTDPRVSDASDSGSSSGGSSDSTPAPEEIVITPAGVQGFWFTGMLGGSAAVSTEVNGSTMEFRLLTLGGTLHTTLGQLRQLKAQGITHITFRTLLCTTTFAIDDLLPLGGDDTEVVLTHTGTSAKLMVGGAAR